MRLKRRYRWAGPAIGLSVVAWMGCGSGPFQVSGPPLPERPVGFALVSSDVPPFIRGVVQRVRIRVTSADTSRMDPILREMNFPIPGGSLAAGEVADIPSGLRQFLVTAFDTQGELRFQGSATDSVGVGRATTVAVTLARIGGKVRFTGAVAKSDLSSKESTADSLAAVLASSGVLDIVELNANPTLPRLSLASSPVSRFTKEASGYTRQTTIEVVPSGTRRFAGVLRDLSRGSRFAAFSDTSSVKVQADQLVDVRFSLKRLNRVLTDQEFVFPADSTVVSKSPNF